MFVYNHWYHCKVQNRHNLQGTKSICNSKNVLKNYKWGRGSETISNGQIMHFGPLAMFPLYIEIPFVFKKDKNLSQCNEILNALHQV